MRTLRDCVYGLAVGDALGVPFEGQARGTFTCTGMVGGGAHGKTAGTFSDDTSLALALCDSIRACGCIDCSDIRQRFETWLLAGAYTVDGTFGVGGATRRALVAGRGQAGERDNGNGSLMRTAPLAFTAAGEGEVRAVSAITHAHPTSTQACVDAVQFARLLAAGTPVREAATDIGQGDTPQLARAEVRSSAYVEHTLQAAIWCLANTASYPECVLAAVNLGADTDTTAAVAGACAGIVYGADAIPATWLETLRGKDLIAHCLF